MFIPLVHDRLALNPRSFTIEFDSLETAPNGYVNVFRSYPMQLFLNSSCSLFKSLLKKLK